MTREGQRVKMVLLVMAMLACATPVPLTAAHATELTVCGEGPPDGEPVVLIPGLSGCSYGFRKLTPLLHERGWRTIIIEPLGVGNSSRPHGADYTMTAQAGRIAALLDSLAVDQAVFVAQGIGGAIIFRLAVERPDLLAGLVSVEAGAAEIAISPHSKNRLRMAKTVARLGGKNILRDLYAESLMKSSGDTSWIDRRTVGRYFRGMGRDIPAAMDAMTAMATQTEPWNMTSRLPEIKAPVIVLLGDVAHDGELTTQDIQDLREGLAEVEFRRIPGAGHFIYEEQPQTVADAVAGLVAYLTGSRSASIGTALVSGDNGGTDLVQPIDPR